MADSQEKLKEVKGGLEDNKRKLLDNLPRSLTTVTTFSKLVALFLFILLPFAGFAIGARYQEKLDSAVSITDNVTNNQQTGSTWNTYTNTKYGFSFDFPSEYAIKSDLPDIDPSSSSRLGFKHIQDEKEIIKFNKDCMLRFSKGINPCDLGPQPQQREFDVYVEGRSSDTSLDSIIKKQISDEKEVKIGEQTFVRGIENQPGGTTAYVISDPDMKFLVLFDLRDELNKNVVNYDTKKVKYTSSEIINKVLSSFKFLDHNISPTPTCVKRPACLDATPRCMIAEPVNGWCQ